MKFIKDLFLVTTPTLLFTVLILEVFFRVIIPASEFPESFYYEEEEMFAFSNENEEGAVTIGKFSEIRSDWRINNFGWNYPIDYEKNEDQEKQLIAVIGDSYIEAFQVNVGKNYPYILNQRMKDNYDVYAFGKSGAPLSQYLQMSRYVNKHFDPDILIFNLVHNDFDESIAELVFKANYLQLEVDAQGQVNEIRPIPDKSTSQYKPIRKWIKKSALFRYLYFNLHVDQMLRKSGDADKKSYEANVDVGIVRNADVIRQATEYLIKTIKDENAGKMVVFVTDAPRAAIYSGKLKESEVLWMNEMVEEICTANGIKNIDLTSAMQKDYQRNSEKFNSDLDFHWNEYGHQFVADEVFKNLRDTIQFSNPN